MSLFSRERPGEDELSTAGGGEVSEAGAAAEAPIAGDRGIPSINRARSVQSRMSSLFAIALMSTLGLGLLGWYYTKALTRPGERQHAAQQALKTRAQLEMTLPPLGAIPAPDLRPTAAVAPSSPADPATIEKFLGPAPPLPAPSALAGAPPGTAPYGMAEAVPPKSPGELAFERRLTGPAFARASGDGAATRPALAAPIGDGAPFTAARQGNGPAAEARDSTDALRGLLEPTVTPAVTASVLPTRRLLLAKGAFIDCTLETAIDSTLPGMTTCITATDTFSADGSVVLLERGTKLVGETRGEVQQGAARIFVLWSEARTPTGVVVPLSSPATDELGRSGLPGEVNRHFWDRFGAAILLTVINGAVQGAVNARNSSGSVVVSPGTSTDVMAEVLKSTLNVPPTVTKEQGARIQVFVARDVDFRSVYALRVANSGSQVEKPPP